MKKKKDSIWKNKLPSRKKKKKNQEGRMADFPGDFIGKVPEVSFHKNRAEWKKDI